MQISRKKITLIQKTSTLIKPHKKVYNLILYIKSFCYKQPSSGALVKGYSQKCATNLRENTYGEVSFKNWQSKFIEIALWHRCSPVNLLYIFGNTFHKNVSVGGCFCLAVL